MSNVPCQIYNYFELDTIDIFNKPIVLVKRVDKSALGGVKTSQVQKTHLDKNHRQ